MEWNDVTSGRLGRAGAGLRRAATAYRAHVRVQRRVHDRVARALSAAAMVALGGIAAGGLGGCQSYQGDADVIAETRAGEFGAARLVAANRATRDPSDRSFMLDRMKIMLLAQADGVPESAESIADRLYDFLRTQGVNRDNTVASFFAGEQGARVWKGEPFEQAMAYHAISVFDATRGDWGNVRASAGNSLFALRDFSKTFGASSGRSGRPASQAVNPTAGQEYDAQTRERLALLEEAARDERARGGDALARYTPSRSDFEVGYAMHAIASRQLGETQDMQESVAALANMRPEMAALAQVIATGRYNTVFVVDFGLAPRKMGAGPDNTIAVFRPVTASDSAALQVSVNDRSAGTFPVVTDVNRLAQDLKWNNLEDMRRAKSALGDVLVLGGAAVAVGAEDDEAKMAGAAAAIAGLLLKATAGADTRHCEVLPQRVYIAPVWLEPGLNTVRLEIPGRGTMVIPDVPAPPDARVFARYVRLGERMGGWASSAQVLYSNDVSGAARVMPPAVSVGGRASVQYDEDGNAVRVAAAARLPARAADLPYILGGACVRLPTEETLRAYQRAGFLRGFTLNDLIDLYKEEGIWLENYSQEPGPRRHILEGGTSLYTPEPGSAGFVRLYGQAHGAYQARSARVREVAEECRVVLEGGPAMEGLSAR